MTRDFSHQKFQHTKVPKKFNNIQPTRRIFFHNLTLAEFSSISARGLFFMAFSRFIRNSSSASSCSLRAAACSRSSLIRCNSACSSASSSSSSSDSSLRKEQSSNYANTMNGEDCEVQNIFTWRSRIHHLIGQCHHRRISSRPPHQFRVYFSTTKAHQFSFLPEESL